jgi:MoaA/NifB/PqqE/SkfB family radical SAM enzyme
MMVHQSKSARGLSLGVGLTTACDLACAHCYRDTQRVDQLSLDQVVSACECLPVRSVNLGTGKNGGSGSGGAARVARW